MPRKPGKPAGSMKWHVLRYPERPGTFVELGAILKDPYEVEDALTQDGGVTSPPLNDIKDVSEATTMAIQSNLATQTHGHLRALIPTSLPVDVGGSMGAGAESDIESTVRACNVRAKVFRPSEEYMNDVLRNTRVVKHLRESGFGGHTLYVIVGMATAQNLVVSEATNRGRHAEGELHTAVPTMAEAGAGLASGKSFAKAVDFTIDHDVVFAYRVKEFHWSRIRRKLKEREHITEGAMFDTEDKQSGEGTVPSMEDYDFEFEEFLDDNDSDGGDDVSTSGSEYRGADANDELDFWV
ncbi:hypothetical protein NM208_g1945 [Fusarium decemcellulare]|uniref:Uncharacterized protein n=1 Tax=Fusarium decemcellulare TaxID=57161 RepID=A0ACC1SU43_9HYPO|nr:hypothetical protein NM208_g1945 [Fusarium decemcellulare]